MHVNCPKIYAQLVLLIIDKLDMSKTIVYKDNILNIFGIKNRDVDLAIHSNILDTRCIGMSWGMAQPASYNEIVD